MLKTLIVEIKENFQEKDLERELYKAAKILNDGGLVAFPTETVYGLGGNALDKNASKKIYQAKGRPSDNPLIIHIAKYSDIEKIATNIPKSAYTLIDKFWPGPLTIILNKNKIVPDETTGGLDTVAIRMPDNKIARRMIEISNVFVAAPSANTSGRPSPTKAEHVIDDMMGKIDMIIDGGNSTLGLESTIIDFTGEVPTVLRPGFITVEQIRCVIGQVKLDPAIESLIVDCNLKPKAPGMKYKHYAPKGELIIYQGSQDEVIKNINKFANEKIAEGKIVGIISTEETRDKYNCAIIKVIGSRRDEKSIASRLYSVLREFDDINTDVIITESFSDNDLGQAIMNRLLKAAGYNVVQV